MMSFGVSAVSVELFKKPPTFRELCCSHSLGAGAAVEAGSVYVLAGTGEWSAVLVPLIRKDTVFIIFELVEGTSSLVEECWQ